MGRLGADADRGACPVAAIGRRSANPGLPGRSSGIGRLFLHHADGHRAALPEIGEGFPRGFSYGHPDEVRSGRAASSGSGPSSDGRASSPRSRQPPRARRARPGREARGIGQEPQRKGPQGLDGHPPGGACLIGIRKVDIKRGIRKNSGACLRLWQPKIRRRAARSCNLTRGHGRFDPTQITHSHR